MKTILIDNPSDLPLIPLDEIHLFQGDFKEEPTPDALDKLVRSILAHNMFIAKAIFYEDGKAYTEDGHQTLKALRRLQELGYTTCEVIAYELQDGRMQESGRESYDQVMIPCQVIVPKGDTPEARRKDAAEKLLQINSRYATINPATTFFDELGFSFDEMDEMLARTAVPDFEEFLFGGSSSLADSYDEEFDSYDDHNCLYPIAPRFSEKYDAVIIVSDNETDTAFLKSVLEIREEQSYKATKMVGESMVITVKRFQELWRSK